MLMIVAAPWRWDKYCSKSKLGSFVGSLGWDSAGNDSSSGRFWVALGSLLGHSSVSPMDSSTTDGPPVYEALHGLVQLAGTPA